MGPFWLDQIRLEARDHRGQRLDERPEIRLDERPEIGLEAITWNYV